MTRQATVLSAILGLALGGCISAPATENRNEAATGGWTKITEGSRNQSLANLAGSMRRRGMTRESIEAALREENSRRCDPPSPTPIETEHYWAFQFHSFEPGRILEMRARRYWKRAQHSRNSLPNC